MHFRLKAAHAMLKAEATQCTLTLNDPHKPLCLDPFKGSFSLLRQAALPRIGGIPTAASKAPEFGIFGWVGLLTRAAKLQVADR